jgi:hypothetical protein
MTATLLYRIAAVLFVIFAAGHTVGFLRFRPTSPEGRAVWDSMHTVRVQLGRGSFTYGGFYVGFGLYNTVFLLFSAVLAWHLSNVAATTPQAIGLLGWAFCATQVAGAVLCWRYFAPPPVILSVVIAVCLGWAALIT